MFNNIGPEARELIAKALYETTALKNLRLTGNKLKIKVECFLQQCYKLIHP